MLSRHCRVQYVTWRQHADTSALVSLCQVGSATLLTLWVTDYKQTLMSCIYLLWVAALPAGVLAAALRRAAGSNSRQLSGAGCRCRVRGRSRA